MPEDKEKKDLPPVSTEPWVPLPPEEWTEPEKWAWERIRTGQAADFNEDCDSCPLPWNAWAWKDEVKKQRRLRSDFLRTVLLCEPWRGLISHIGVVIVGAYFEEPVNLSHAEVGCLLAIMRSRLSAGLYCLSTRFKYSLNLQGSYCKPVLSLVGAEIMGSLLLHHGHFTAAHLNRIQLSGSLSLAEAKFTDMLAIDGAEIKDSLFMDKGHFAATRLLGIRVGMQFSTKSSEFSGELAMDRAEIGGAVFMRGGRFASARLPGIRVGGQVDMKGAEFSGNLALDDADIKESFFAQKGRFASMALVGLKVGGQLVMGGVRSEGPLVMERLRVAHDIIMRQAKFNKVYLNNAYIGGHVICEGAYFAELNLSGTKIDTFYDGKTKVVNDIWPEALCIDRFAYNYIQGSGLLPDKSIDLTDRPASWFVSWLARQKKYSPQPYQQCAKVLREAGQPWKAAEVLFAGKERERKNSVWYRWLWLWLLKWSVGYGLGWRFKVFPAVLGAIMLAAGTIVSYYSPDVLKEHHSFGWSLGLSLNRLLPLITLSKDFADFVFHGWQKAWFIGQALFGWVLAFFIAAGLAGVGKPGGRD